jgi:GNAT superfamily N-acetyltransferase
MTLSIVASREVGGRGYQIDTDRDRLDFALIHHFLADCSHWARGVSRVVLRRAIDHSLPFGLYRDDGQVGFARVVTDMATFAYLADVFVLPEERSRGLGQWLVETILADRRLLRLRRWLLVTRDAEHLYRRCGFAELRSGLSYLERFDADSCAETVPMPNPFPRSEPEATLRLGLRT